MEIYGNGCRELLLADPDLERQLVSSDNKEMVEGKGQPHQDIVHVTIQTDQRDTCYSNDNLNMN